MEPEEKRKYTQMENVLIKFNQKYISLPEDQKKRNGKILETIIESIVTKCKENDDLFRHMYERKFYGGSYYDGLKVGKPEEYDLDCVLNLPLLAEPDVEISDRPGFVCVRIKEYVKLLKAPDGKRFEKLDTLMDGQYLSTPKVLAWMERVMALALKDIKKDETGSYFEIDIGHQNPVRIYAYLMKAYPAFTLKLRNEQHSITFDVDLVPCFQFTAEKWPKGKYRPNPKPLKNKFLVVPKKPYESKPSEDISRYLRLSFQEQERELIKGHEYNKMKPTIKLLKFIKDKYNHKIASYFIKTVFLWEVHERADDTAFWTQSLSIVFMEMLQKYAELIEKKSIPYFWNKNFNLIGHLKDSTVKGIANFLKRLINDVKSNLDDPFRITKYLLSPDDVEILKSEVPLGKKKINNNLDLSREYSTDSSEVSSAKHFSSLANSRGAETFTLEEDSFDGLDGSSSGISSNSFPKINTSNLRNYLANSSDILADVIEQLYEQNRELQESNKVILNTCRQLEARVASLERKCDTLTQENRLLTQRANEIDRLSLIVRFFGNNSTHTDRPNM